MKVGSLTVSLHVSLRLSIFTIVPVYAYNVFLIKDTMFF